MNKRILWWLLSAAVTLVLIGGCERKPAGSRDHTIGMLAPLTGNAARFGESQRNGVQLALDEVNAAEGGPRFRLVIEDTKSEPSTALTAFTRLAERGDLLCVFGSAASLDVPAYLPMVDKTQLPHVVPVAVLPTITESGSTWTFRTALNDRTAAVQMAEFAVKTLQADQIGMLIEDSAFGETGLHFKRRAEELGASGIAVERLKRGDLDVRPQLTKLKTQGVTHLQFWGYYAEYALVAKQMRELGFHAQLMGNQAPVNEKTLELAGDALEGAINICLFVPTDTSPLRAEFAAKYTKRFGQSPDTWAAQSYDAMRLVAEAVRNGGTNAVLLREKLKGTRAFPGVTGELSFDASGDAQPRSISVVEVVRGKFVPYSR